ncbi:Protein of unknown function DUF2249 [Allomeiothermus silvanus DSM 9946]|uniref:DUF2249 domain-containing protein n=2 Tax=Allomeiothermus silvanus TaxID=52022 RepID=D7BHH0_ALLS1|nr:DUF2249 domain-containing protein [Allomeiothermus silvanus]ADH62208.1 Protein of unknown function DUF2249 [Allomeiothermus silvanus DSM 9946]
MTQVMAKKAAPPHTEAEVNFMPIQILDVRSIPPRERHPRIFHLFDSLGDGQAFELVNDHDPKPLFYQFSAERPEQFGWEYLEQGPETWRVRIRKKG